MGVGVNAFCRNPCKNRIVYTYAQESLQGPGLRMFIPLTKYKNKENDLNFFLVCLKM